MVMRAARPALPGDDGRPAQVIERAATDGVVAGPCQSAEHRSARLEAVIHPFSHVVDAIHTPRVQDRRDGVEPRPPPAGREKAPSKTRCCARAVKVVAFMTPSLATLRPQDQTTGGRT